MRVRVGRALVQPLPAGEAILPTPLPAPHPHPDQHGDARHRAGASVARSLSFTLPLLTHGRRGAMSRRDHESLMRKIVLTTIGTLGDLHPFIAIGLALRARGFTPVLAVPDDHVRKCQLAGLEAVAIQPGFEATRVRMGLSHAEAVRRVIANQRVMFEQVLLPSLGECARALDAVAADAEAIVTSIFVFAGPMIAEKRALPLVSVILQPMAMLSAFDPPHTPDFWMMRGAPQGAVGRAWNRMCYGLIRQGMQWLYGRRIDRVRVEHGLPPAGARRVLDSDPRSILQLGCYSTALAPLPPDVAGTTRIVGFPMFDSNSGAEEPLDPVLAAFLAAGPPPLVFTLGSFAVNSAGDFYPVAVLVARRLNRRAVLLMGGDAPPRIEGDVLRCGYAPHSHLFASAAAIIHHGGAGTTGQALRAGKPQLVVPHMGDQNDHAHRIARLGAGLALRVDRFTPARAARHVARLLREPGFAVVAAELARQVSQENGAAAAADAIVQALAHRAAAPAS